jgi:hypothetical protein
VRSQDKTKLVKVSNISLKEIRKPYTNEFDCYGIGTYYDNLQVLGKYVTKERALEVLDEIENIVKPRMEQLYTYVYKMPKE